MFLSLRHEGCLSSMIHLCVIVFNFELFGVCRKGCRARAFSTTRPSKMKTCSPSSSALISSKRGEQTGCSAFQCLREFSFSLKLKCLMRGGLCLQDRTWNCFILQLGRFWGILWSTLWVFLGALMLSWAELTCAFYVAFNLVSKCLGA